MIPIMKTKRQVVRGHIAWALCGRSSYIYERPADMYRRANQPKQNKIKTYANSRRTRQNDGASATSYI